MLIAVRRDHTAFLEPVVGHLLSPGESLRAALRVDADPGIDNELSVRDELIELVNPLNWIGLGAHPGQLLRLWTYGRAVVGGADSVAAAVHTASKRAGSGRALVVTDTRLLVARLKPTGQLQRLDSGGYMFETGELVAEWPRATVVGAAARPKGLLRRGRIEVQFGDGSRCALLGSPAYHARVVAAELARPFG
jgi:hypothetical protein